MDLWSNNFFLPFLQKKLAKNEEMSSLACLNPNFSTALPVPKPDSNIGSIDLLSHFTKVKCNSLT